MTLPLAPILTTNISPLPRFTVGKVRDVYDLGDALLLVATDRLSAFDVVLPTGIPGKGKVLTQLSRFWFERTAHLVPNHVIAADWETIAPRLEAAGVAITPELTSILDGRTLLVQKCEALPVECVVRGYLAGSLWKEYTQFPAHGGEIILYGTSLPAGLRECEELPRPLFTPATKAEVGGHDQNISLAEAAQIVGDNIAAQLEQISLALYTFARDFAQERGLILADTKFEFGILDGQIILIDEALTPDSSRFWEAAGYQPGRAQPSYDKQFVRDYLEGLDWNKTAPGPVLPERIVDKTAAKYQDALRLLAGEDFSNVKP